MLHKFNYGTLLRNMIVSRNEDLFRRGRSAAIDFHRLTGLRQNLPLELIARAASRLPYVPEDSISCGLVK